MLEDSEYSNEEENMDDEVSDNENSADFDHDDFVGDKNEDSGSNEGEVPHTSSGAQLIDKDDPRSRLHFVKYMKREGKTQKIWECGICSKEFRHQYTLMRHLPTHTDERNFKCDICGKAFRQLSTLSQHKAIHSDARPYICEYCKKTFNRVSTLISHRKTHSENKPHKCHLCGKGFHQKGNLRNHVFTHTNERPYKCERCGKGFNQMSNLVCHKVKAHADVEKMQYSCSICNEEFPRRFALRAHEEYKHGIKYRQPTPQVAESETRSSKKSNSIQIVRLPGPSNNSTYCQSRDTESPDNFTDCIVVDKINTKAMENAVLQDQTPFALLKSAKEAPILVKVLSTSDGDKHCLLPATPEDLQGGDGIALDSTLSTDEDGIKTLQVKVPIVACIVQNIDNNGEYKYTIEGLKSDEEQEEPVTTMDPDIEFIYEQLESMPQSAEPSSDLVGAEQSNWSTEEAMTEDCNELLELAAQGDIKFVRATDDGRYEMITDTEARQLIAQQNSHDIRILEGEEADAISELHRIQERAEQRVAQDLSPLVVLDPETQHNVLETLENTEYFDKNSTLDDKTMADQFMENIAFLSQQSKMDDFIICPKTFEIDGVLAAEGNHDAIDIHKSEDCLFSQPDEFSQSLSNLQPSISELLNENQQPGVPAFDRAPSYSYPKTVHGLNEKSNVWSDENERAAKENRLANANQDYVACTETDDITDIADFIQSEIKPSCDDLEHQRSPEDEPAERIANDFDMFGSKNLIFNDFMMSSYPEIRFLEDLPRFSKGSAIGTLGFDGLSSDFDEMEDILMNASLERDKSSEEMDSGFVDDLTEILDSEKPLC